jgi:hypothetical protein
VPRIIKPLEESMVRRYRKMRSRGPTGQTIDITGAKKKLRQAEFFLWHLEDTSREIAHHANSFHGENTEHLEFFFSACLSAAQSVYYVLEGTGGSKFKETQRRWRADGLQDGWRSKFARMIGLRGEDVHLATTGAEALPKYVEEDWRHQNQSQSPYYQPQVYNAALCRPRPVIEEVNPDGTTVRASVLRGTVGLYIDIEQHGQRVEATTACREFIRQLRSLLDVVKAGEVPS